MLPRTLDNVDRVDRPSAHEFASRYLAPPRPCVVRGLFAGQPIDNVKTIEDAIARWGDLVLPVQLEYTTQATTRRGKQLHLSSIRQFLALDPAIPATRKLVITEQDTPPAIKSMFDVGDYATMGGVSADDLVSKVFVGHAGHYAHLHFDIDGRPVLLVQLFGRKRVMVIPPHRSQELDPLISERAGNMSSRYIEHLSEDEKLAFAREVGAYDAIIEPGEAMFMPTGWWHYIDYLDTAMSINVRLGRTRLQRDLYALSESLASKHQHLWQMIVQPFATGQPPSPLAAEADALLALMHRAKETSEPGDVTAFGEAVVALYRKVHPDGYTRVLHVHDLDRMAPVDQLFVDEPPPDPPPDPDNLPVWAKTGVALGAKIQLATPLDRDALLVLRDGVAFWEIAAPEELPIVRRLLSALLDGPCTVDQLAERCEQSIFDVLGFLDELAVTGCVVAPPRRPR